MVVCNLENVMKLAKKIAISLTNLKTALNANGTKKAMTTEANV